MALRSVTATLAPLEPGVQVEVSTSWTTSHRRLDAEESIHYTLDFSVTGNQPCAPSIHGQLVLSYRVSGLAALPEDQLQAFGEVSAVFSAFPYVRELVQSLTVRAGLPALVLGTLRAPIDPPSDLLTGS